MSMAETDAITTVSAASSPAVYEYGGARSYSGCDCGDIRPAAALVLGVHAR